MNKIRIYNIVVGALVILAAVLVFKAVGPAASAKESSHPVVGFGDLRRFESQAISHPSVGFGDLRRYEAQTSSQASAGFGDLRRIEALQAAKTPVYAGMGDLRRFEALSSK